MMTLFPLNKVPETFPSFSLIGDAGPLIRIDFWYEVEDPCFVFVLYYSPAKARFPKVCKAYMTIYQTFNDLAQTDYSQFKEELDNLQSTHRLHILASNYSDQYERFMLFLTTLGAGSRSFEQNYQKIKTSCLSSLPQPNWSHLGERITPQKSTSTRYGSI